jgi:hypothetical protein
MYNSGWNISTVFCVFGTNLVDFSKHKYLPFFKETLSKAFPAPNLCCEAAISLCKFVRIRRRLCGNTGLFSISADFRTKYAESVIYLLQLKTSFHGSAKAAWLESALRVKCPVGKVPFG